jgi:putative Mn2+ efflux pump MntP
MNFDLRLPIGIMFSVFGLILTIFGAISDKKIYEEHSLGININLIWGIVLLVFGLFMLFLALKGGKKSGPPKA